MDKLYYLVCEDKETTLFEGRYQGRTRGAALKFLKHSLGRNSLNGLVFTITEIPVPLIREVVAEIMASHSFNAPPPEVSAQQLAPEPKVEHSDTVEETAGPEPPAVKREPNPITPKTKADPTTKIGNPGHGNELWDVVKAHWKKCRNLRETAMKFGLSPNTVKTRARRENWKGDAQ